MAGVGEPAACAALVSDWRLSRAVRVLRAGGIIAYPTEAVYGLGCDPLDEEAVCRLLLLKRRPIAKGLILIAARYEQLAPLVVEPAAEQAAIVRASWPGPVTWVLSAAPGVPPWLCGAYRSLAVRVTAHPVAAALCARFDGPLVSTSANVAGRPPARSALAVRRAFGDGVDYVVVGRTGGLRRPSVIRDGTSGALIRA